MEFHGGGSGGVIVSGSNVPAFLTKLWTLVEDPDADPLICWSPVSYYDCVYWQSYEVSYSSLPK